MQTFTQPPTLPTARRYHELAGPRSPMLAILTSVAVLFLSAIASSIPVFVAFIAADLAGRPTEDGMPTEPMLRDLPVLAGLFLLVPLALMAARVMQNRPAGSVHSVTGRLRLGWLGRCLAIAAIVVAGLIGTLIAVAGGEGPDRIDWATVVLPMLLYVILVPLQAAGEEYMCRGWLLQTFGSFTRGPWVGIAVSTVVFTAAHGWGTGWGALSLVVYAVSTGWLTVRTGGLEAAVAFHAVYNTGFAVLAALAGEVITAGSMADADLVVSLAIVPFVLLYAAVAAWQARRRGVTTAEAVPSWTPEHVTA